MLKIITRARKEVTTILASLKRGESFARSFSYLFSSKVLTILMSLLITPVLTRLYAPDAYGYLSVFTTITMNLAILSTLAYDSSLVVVKEESKFYNLFVFCAINSLFVAILLLFVLNIQSFNTLLKDLLDSDIDLNFEMVGMISFSAFIFPVAQFFPSWNVRRKDFGYAAMVGGVSQIISRACALTLGFFLGAPFYGLIASEIAAKLSVLIINAKKYFSSEWSQLVEVVSVKEIKQVVVEQGRYPKFVLPARYASLLASQLPVIIYSIFFNVTIVGNYGLANGLLQVPIVLLGNTLSPIILNKTVELKDNEVVLRKFVIRLLLAIIVVSMPIFLGIICLSEMLFPVFFGDSWRMAGNMASILAISAMPSLINIFSLPIFQVYNQENKILLFHMLHLVLCTLGMSMGALYGNYETALVVYTLTYALVMFIQTSYSFALLKIKMRLWILGSFVCLILAYLVKILFI